MEKKKARDIRRKDAMNLNVNLEVTQEEGGIPPKNCPCALQAHLLLTTLSHLKTPCLGWIWFECVSSKGSCAGSLILSMVVLGQSRTFKRWNLVEGD